MTTQTKNEIRRRLIQATGEDLGEVKPEYFVSGSTPAPALLPTKISPDNIGLLCLFLHRFEPFAQPRKSELIWTFHCN